MGILSSFYNVLLIVIGFGVLIFVHELGHFLAAKWAKIRTEGFAVGMGPVMFSWRKGIGLCAGSTTRKYQKRVREYLKAENITLPAPAGKSGEPVLPPALRDCAEAALGLGETEYSLRWLPVGGFVKMLGQEDTDPTAVSDDPRSYNTCAISKRMIVVSAGVVMNVLLAMVLFIVAFLVGVKFEAPVVGDVDPALPAGSVMAENASALGVTEPGLKPGDEVLSIDGKPIRAFHDIRIAGAMAKPGEQIHLKVKREGLEAPLEFSLIPELTQNEGLLSIGVYPASSARLYGEESAEVVAKYLRERGLAESGLEPGMRLVSVEGEPVSTYGELVASLDDSDGFPLRTMWTAVDEDGLDVGEQIEFALPMRPVYQLLRQEASVGGEATYDRGLFGLCPLTRISEIAEGSPNEELLLPGDILLKAGWVDFPRISQLQKAAADNARGELELVLRRGDEDIEVTAKVDRNGKMGVAIVPEETLPIIAGPVTTALARGGEDGELESKPTPAAPLNLMPGVRFDAVNGTPIEDWPSLRAAMMTHTAEAYARYEGASLEIDITHPTQGRETDRVQLALSADDVKALNELGWSSDLAPFLFEPIFVKRNAGGNPVTALAMGFEETHKLIVLTYLTIDRLFRGSVGVEQLRGPIGIIDIGAKVLPKGFMYFLFFLGMISVNLAVINFLPIPIVDGGLFLFLVYEKAKGRPPSPAFQTAAFYVGLALIGALFLVTFYNDIARILS